MSNPDLYVFRGALLARLDLAMLDAKRDFPLVSQTRQRVLQVISQVGPDIFTAGRNGLLLLGSQPLPALKNLLNSLSDYYYQRDYSNWTSYNRKLKEKITESKEWEGFLKQTAEPAEAHPSTDPLRPEPQGRKVSKLEQGPDRSDQPQSAGAAGGSENEKDKKSQDRARDVKTVRGELTTLVGEITDRSKYEPAKKRHPEFLTFAAAEKLRPVDFTVHQLNGRQPLKKLSFQIVAALNDVAWETVKKDWSKYGMPTRKARSSAKGQA